MKLASKLNFNSVSASDSKKLIMHTWMQSWCKVYVLILYKNLIGPNQLHMTVLRNYGER